MHQVNKGDPALIEDKEEEEVPKALILPSKWEYHRLKVRDTATLPIPALNALGENGWELIEVFKHHADLVFLFKRMKEQK